MRGLNRTQYSIVISCKITKDNSSERRLAFVVACALETCHLISRAEKGKVHLRERTHLLVLR